MRWASIAVSGSDLGALLAESLARLRPALPGRRADLAFVFLAAEHAGGAEEALARVRDGLGSPYVLGCTAGGVIGGGREFEQVPALALLAGSLPGVAVHGVHVRARDLPDGDSSPRPWHELVGTSPVDHPSFVVVADPFTLPAEALVEGLDFAYPGSVTVGGLASGARRRGEQVLFLDDRVLREGAALVALMGDVEVVPAVAQGCLAIGRSMRITRCDGHALVGLDGKPVLEVLQEVLASASARERLLAERALLLGFETDPFTSGEDGPWLVRNLLGIDAKSQSLYVGEPLRLGRRVRFHVRDRETSAEDLERTLERAGRESGEGPDGALLFSCLGRGRHLYGVPDHDSRTFRRRFGDVPLGGFFCSGEIGPVGHTTHLHGYTSSFGLIRTPGA